jgi:tetratricopeptide (TPR) repeat protein
MGKTELAIERAQRLLRLIPFNSLNRRAHHALAISYFHNQRYGDAAEAARRVIDANLGYSLPRAILAAALMRFGRTDEAKAAVQAVLECQPSFTIRGTLVAVGLEPAVFRPLADAWREVGLPE